MAERTGTATQGSDVREALERLRGEHSGWRIEYVPGRGVSWIALCVRGVGWRGGFPLVEAVDRESLTSLLGLAVQQDARLAARVGRCVR